MSVDNAIIGMIIGSAIILAFIGIAWYVLCIIGNWKVFTKAGEAGWKSIIPIYNNYILFKIGWNTKWFWYMILAGAIGSVCSNFTDSLFAAIGGLVLSLATMLIIWIQQYKLSKAFGHGIGFAIGLILLNPIFTMILGLGNSKYTGQRQ